MKLELRFEIGILGCESIGLESEDTADVLVLNGMLKPLTNLGEAIYFITNGEAGSTCLCLYFLFILKKFLVHGKVSWRTFIIE